MAWLDITDELTEEGKKNLTTKNILMFNHKKAGPIHLKIMRKTKNKVWAKRTYAYTPDEADAEVEVTQNEKS